MDISDNAIDELYKQAFERLGDEIAAVVDVEAGLRKIIDQFP
jgi:hypothetical protein